MADGKRADEQQPEDNEVEEVISEKNVGDTRTPNEIAAESQGKLEATDGGEVEPTPGYSEGEAERVEGEDAVAETTRDVLEASEKAADSEPVKAWDHAIDNVMETMSEGADLDPFAHNQHSYSDTVALPVLGTVTLPGGIYTAVYISLGIFTLLEVLIAEIFATSGIKIALLMAIAVVKATLVIWFYMHLNYDARKNPLLYIVLLLPLTVTMLSIFYLLGVPSLGGLGYGAVY